jgi:alpha-glucosidase
MTSPDLNIAIKSETSEFTLSYKGVILLEHSPRFPCVELANANPDLRMNPRFIAYYKLKNKVSNRRPLVAVEKIISGDDITIEFDKVFRLHARVVLGRLELVPELINRDIETMKNNDHFIINIKADETEAIYGCGEQFSFLNLRGRRVPLWTLEPGIVKNHSPFKYLADAAIGAGGEWWTTYYPQPTFITSRNYFVHVETHAYAEFDFRAKSPAPASRLGS